MNVNIDTSISQIIKTIYTPKKSDKTEQFKKVLDCKELNFKKDLSLNVPSSYTKSQNKKNTKSLNKVIIKIKSENLVKTKNASSKKLVGINKLTEGRAHVELLLQSLSSKIENVDKTSPKILNVIQKLTTQVKEAKGDLSLLKVVDEKNTVEGKTNVKGQTTVDLNNQDFNTNVESKVIDFVELAIKAIKQNTEKSSEQLVSNDNSTGKVAQVQQVLQSVGSLLQSLVKTSATSNDKNENSFVNIEHLLGVEKLDSKRKNLVKNNLSEIVDLIKSSKIDKTSPKIFDVIQKLTTKVKDVKGDLSLLKVVDEKNTVESKTTVKGKISVDLNNQDFNTKIESKVIDFVELAIKEIKQNTVKSTEQLVGNDNSTEKVAQVQHVLQFVGSLLQRLVKTSTINNDKNENSSVNIEHLLGVDKVDSKTKTLLKNNFSEIVDLIKSSKIDKTLPKILDVIQKLTTKVKEVKGDLSLLKVPDKKNTVESKTTVKAQTTVDLNNEDFNTKVESKVIDFVELAIKAIKQNTVKSSEQLVGNDNSTEKVAQVQQVLQSLGSLLQSLVKTSTTSNDKNENSSVNIEHLLGVEKLDSKTKNLLKNNLSEIVDLIKSSKIDKTSPKIFDVIQKLTTQVKEVKGDLSLLKVVDEKNTVEGKTNVKGPTTVDLNNQDFNTKIESKVIDFVEFAIKAIKQNTVKSSEQLVGNDNSTEKVAQVQQVLQSLGSLLQSLVKTSTTSNDKNENSSVNIEHLLGVEKLDSKTKNLLKNNLSEIVDLIKSSKIDKTSPKIFDVIQKLTTKVKEAKGDFSLLKAFNQKSEVTGKTTVDFENSVLNNKLESKVMNYVKAAIDELKQNTEKPLEQLIENGKLPDKVAQIKQVMKPLSSMIQTVDKTSINNRETDLKKLDVLQKLTTKVADTKVNLNSLKDNLPLKELKQSTKMSLSIDSVIAKQGSNNAGQEKKSMGNKSFGDKFLNNLLGQDKDESKISKAVTFMNQFENVKTVDTSKVEVSNITVNKNNFEVDVIKNIKFMETNSIKNLIVKMNPKELGEITIKLTIESGVMKASITAQNKDTYNLLNTNIQDISDRLKNMDIKIHSLDIGIYEDSTFFSKDSNGKNNNGTQNNSGRQNNNSRINIDTEEDIPITNNYIIEENQVNKFV
ncbi:flagellar hook-length control protein FliK [Clostridium psychrophilum]|uniref:flagellar hook-length control protein FliK n=1 Tax=Clostridium psychrophilum TaxID=132926 RepID=UPI001C0CDF47|nr:flagellar hook-length control protein FliK [Clostridium psychrophilum]MBU3180640.1 flagellar hook-length control protein FliK [Clostridium psychrophilum]